MLDDADLAHLDEAVALAERGLCTTAPNPRVGCLIVRDGALLGRGWHQWRGEAHAEVRALQDAGGDVAGATLYVSLEPCCNQGLTPPCVDALIAAKLGRVVVGALDPNPAVNGKGLRQLQAAGIAVDLAQHEAAQALNAPLGHRLASGRPWLRIKMAGSLDGRAAMASGQSQWITGPQARLDGQLWRARSCAVVTGIDTLLADDPMLNVRDRRFAVDGRFRQPLRVVVDSRLRTPPGAKLFKAAGPILIVHAGFPAAAPMPAGTSAVKDRETQLAAGFPAAATLPAGTVRCADDFEPADASQADARPTQPEIVECGIGQEEDAGRSGRQRAARSGQGLSTHPPGPEFKTAGRQKAARSGQGFSGGAKQVDLARLLRLLGARPCNEVLVEAGPTLAGAFISAGLWDEILLYLAPKLLGASARPLFGLALDRLEEAVQGRVIDVQAFGPDLRVRLARV